MLFPTLLLAPLVGAARLGRATQDIAGQVVSPDKYIVEIGSADVESVASKLRSSGAKVLKVFKSDIFSGLSLESKSENIDTLLSIDEVDQAWPVTLHWVDPIVGEKLDFGDISAKNYSVHGTTGVDRLHEEGITGKGVKIAVVDTGIDYRHPALGGCFGSGCKVAGGYDLIGDNVGWQPGDPKRGDDDPIDTLNGHGTHVAGIIAGENDWFKGVAPDATLMAYKISNPNGVSDSDTLMEAFTMAYEDGADIITCSFGGVDGWHNNPWALIASRIVEKGVVVTISAGNGGDVGPFWGSSGSSGDNVLAIASVDPIIQAADPLGLTYTENSESNSTIIAYKTLRYFVEETKQPVIAVNFTNSKPGEYNCDPLPDDTPDLTGYAVLAVWEERCEAMLWMTQLKDRGVASILTYDSKNHDITAPWYWHFGLNVGMIEEDAAGAIQDALASGVNVTVEYMENAGFNVSASNIAGGYASSFTSWGGLYDMRIKPDIAAPGGGIFSTFPDNSWKVLSGTSMSCPYVAGVAALYISRFGGKDEHGAGFGKQMFDRIVSSGSPLSWPEYTGTSYPTPSKFNAPVPQVGNGYINAWKLVNSRTQLSFDKFHLNDTHHFSRYHGIDITNHDDAEVTYEFHLQPAGGFEIQSPSRSYEIGILGDLSPVEMVPKVKMPAGTQKLQPGETKRVEFIFEYPVVEESKLPIYSGNIVVRGTNGDVLQVPYMGAAFNAKKQFKTLFAPETPYQYSGPDFASIGDYHEYAFDLEAQDFPKVDLFVKWGTAQLRWDVFDKDYGRRDWKQWPLVPGENGYVGSATYSTMAFRYGGNWWDSYNYPADEVANFPVRLPRGSANQPRTFWWFGQLANGTQIAPGEYNIRVAALLPFGNPDHEDNWDVWETPTITVKAKE